MLNWLTRISLKVRLAGLIALLCILMVAMVAAALNGMRSSNDDLTHLYYEGLLPSDQVTRMVNEMHHARSQLLLALQHMPGSHFENAHNHDVSMHLNAVDQALRNIDERCGYWRAWEGAKKVEEQTVAARIKKNPAGLHRRG